MLLSLVILLMLAGAINYGSNLGHLITFLLGGIWLTTILHTWRNLLGLAMSAHTTEPVFAGQNAIFQIRIENRSQLARFAITVSKKKILGESSDISSAESHILRLPIAAERRGILKLPFITLHTLYPFGLFKAWCYAELEQTCLVYPKPAVTGQPPMEASYTPSEDGDRGVGADDFVGLRSYRPGDPPRHIDWKANARQRGLLTKQFGGDRTERLQLDWELLPAVSTEERLSLLCRFILLAEGESLSYSLRLPGITIDPGQGERHKHRCLAALACYGING
jgi:uncharacterized protein (DUF58 family)